MKTNWNKFQSSAYVGINYSTIHEEDKQIINSLLIVFSGHKKLKKALEVGVGPNLYPAMVIMPYVENLDLVEYSKENVAYLVNNINNINQDWELFRKYLYARDKVYKPSIFKQLICKVRIKQGSIYTLPSNQYDLVSMFFCAESITDHYPTFARASYRFVRSAKKGGLVLAAFMEKSKGYTVAGVRYPAVSITKEKVYKIFKPILSDMEVINIRKSNKALRDGYSGMLLVVGNKK
jgi:hypothetical protein